MSPAARSRACGEKLVNLLANLLADALNLLRLGAAREPRVEGSHRARGLAVHVVLVDDARDVLFKLCQLVEKLGNVCVGRLGALLRVWGRGGGRYQG